MCLVDERLIICCLLRGQTLSGKEQVREQGIKPQVGSCDDWKEGCVISYNFIGIHL